MGGSSQFHSVLYDSQLPQNNSGVTGDVWFVNSTGLLWFVVSDGSLHELLSSTPIPVQGEAGPTGPAGPQGASYIGSAVMTGTWQPSVEYQPGSIVSWSGFAYLNKQFLSIGDNSMSPNGNPFWQVLAAVNTSRSSELIVMIDGAGVLPTLGTKAFINLPYNCTITGWTILANGVGSCVLDVKYSTLANFPATASIVNGANPALSSAQSAEGSVSTWSVLTLNATDVIEVDLLSVSGSITFLTLAIQTSALN